MGIKIGHQIGEAFNNLLQGIGIGIGQNSREALNKVADRAGATGGRTASRNLLPWVIGGFAVLIGVTVFLGRRS